MNSGNMRTAFVVLCAALLSVLILLQSCGSNEIPFDSIVKTEKENKGKMREEAKLGADKDIDSAEKLKEIYLAGGCFWGMEQLMQSIPGVKDAVSGYANGSSAADANYRKVCEGKTGFRETVKVLYDPSEVSLDQLLLAYFYVIDPTVKDRQGNDIGSQYRTGVYYTDEESKGTVERIADIERERSPEFFVETGILKNFYEAEEYHQDYLEKNPQGYCHIPREAIKLFSELKIDAGAYKRPAEEEIKKRLSEEEYKVTREGATERPFSNAYWNSFQKGIYVDAVTGEPLFSSEDKYESSCGWPAFTRPISEALLRKKEDLSYGMRRTEVLSRAGNSHLGHVFENDPESPNGVRYCINGASLKFIPYEDMEAKGYGQFKSLFD